MLTYTGIARLLLLAILLFPLSSCSRGNEWPTIYLKMGANMLEWQAMQTEWQPDINDLAYSSSPTVWGNLKIYIDEGVWLDIPHADATVWIANGHIFGMNISTWTAEKKRETDPQKVKILKDNSYSTLKGSSSWALRPFPGSLGTTREGVEAWFRRGDPNPPEEGQEYMEIKMVGPDGMNGRKTDYWLSFRHSTDINECFGGLNTHWGLFEDRFDIVPERPTPRYVTGEMQSLAANNGNDPKILLALETMGAEDPRKLPMDEYLRRVDRYMEKVCPEMLDRYGRFREPNMKSHDEK